MIILEGGQHMPGLQEEMLELMMKAEKLGAGNDFEHRVTDSAQKIFEIQLRQ